MNWQESQAVGELTRADCQGSGGHERPCGNVVETVLYVHLPPSEGTEALDLNLGAGASVPLRALDIGDRRIRTMVDSVPRPLKTSSEQIGSRSPLALSWLTLALASTMLTTIPAVSQVTDLEVTESGSDIVLSWATGIGPFRVLRSATPDFYFDNQVVEPQPAVSPVTYSDAADTSNQSYFMNVMVVAEADPPGFIANPPSIQPPVLTSLTPNSGPPGTEVVIAGTGFIQDGSRMTVSFQNAPAEIESFNATSLHVLVPENAVTGGVRVCIATDRCSDPLPFYVTFGPQFQDLTSISYESGTGSLWVADRGTANHVYEIDTSGTMTTRGTVVGAILSHPTLPNNNGRIFFSQSADGTGGIVHYVDSASNTDVNFETGGPTPVRCEGIAARSSQPGVAYLLNGANNLIRQVVDGVGSNVDNFGNFTFNFNRPSGARFDSQNNLYVTSTTKIYRITPPPSATTTEVASGFTAAAGLDLFEIGGVAYLVVADESEGNIYLVKPLGEKMVVHSGLQGPVGVALAAGNWLAGPAMYVAEPQRILRLPDPRLRFVDQEDEKILLSIEHKDLYSTGMQTPVGDGKIRLRVLLNPKIASSGLTAYFRIVDPPDPSPYITGASEGDNLPDTDLSGSVTESASFDAHGVAKADLTVNQDYGGNNFRVEASLTPEPNFVPLAISPTYTTWRRIYIEHDTMWNDGVWIREATTAGSLTATEIKVSSTAGFNVDDQVFVLSTNSYQAAMGESGYVHQVASSPDRIYVDTVFGPGGPGLKHSYAGGLISDAAPFGFVARVSQGERGQNVNVEDLPVAFDDAFTEWRVLPTRGYVPHWELTGTLQDMGAQMQERGPKFFNARIDPGNPEPDNPLNTIHLVSAFLAGNAGGLTQWDSTLLHSWIFHKIIQDTYGLQEQAATENITAHELTHLFRVNQGDPDQQGHDLQNTWLGDGECLMNEERTRTLGVVKLHGPQSTEGNNDLMCIRTHLNYLSFFETCHVP